MARSARSSALSDNASTLSLTHHQTAAEICELFYGASPPAWQVVDRFYDPNGTYENPFITATSKDTIADVHTLARYLSQLDVPKPTAVLCALFRLSADHHWRDAWFRGVSMWNEVNDISECESFDGHKRTMVEHTLHILILPGLHPHTYMSSEGSAASSSESMMSLLLPSSANANPSMRNRHLGMSFWPPSPFHLKLPIITRLAFNDADKITHHRDFWDVKDLLGLLPGMTLVQWVSGRLAAQGIRGVVRAGRALFRSPPRDVDEEAASALIAPPPPSKSAGSNDRTRFTIAPQ
ncbi:hypothetical protein L226DRAFT_529295 [Lentinus tigrinus ALCF2SS1-7]|uniref:Uncharacterized protein n=1 Tax=Lentinus tigrinus ALCF2SS1-6 TaxID=1328759 RepID=A0A5C2SU08_9APHY|nr:hypothetical protein L227DRAFT_569103 [Lentinus tigrinus ALCF2SS1-6]RPD80833.1 hypothetical protein L226DRAFT_529295 [Lentinus tigrinus ALCF2SS1-7]